MVILIKDGGAASCLTGISTDLTICFFLLFLTCCSLPCYQNIYMKFLVVFRHWTENSINELLTTSIFFRIFFSVMKRFSLCAVVRNSKGKNICLCT